MHDTPLDPRHARLVALLYDELPPDEAQDLREELARDASLRAEWMELQSTREMVTAWEVEETAPAFVFIEPPSAAATGPGGRIRGLRPGRIAAWSGWGLAAAAFLVFGLAGAGVRYERHADGFSLHLGGRPTGGATLAAHDRGGVPARPGGYIQTVAALGDTYVTSEALEAHTEQLLQLIGRVVSEERLRQQREIKELIVDTYGDINDRQVAGYRDLRGRIDAVNTGIKLGQSGLVRNPDGTTAPAIVDTLEAMKPFLRQRWQRGWRLGDFPNEPERP